MTRVTCRMALALTLLIPLSGCELLLVAPTLPGLFPGLGTPLTGKVVDAVTGLPLGDATITGGILSTAKTEPDGSFKLYGNIGQQGIAIARAGYTSLSYVSNRPLASGQTYHLSPIFTNTGLPSSKHVTLKGSIRYKGNPIAVAGGVVFGGIAAAMTNNGAFSMPIRELLPGSVHSAVLAGGTIQGGPILPETGQSPADFSFNAFGYRFADIPFADKPNVSTLTLDALDVGNIPIQALSVSYTNSNPFSRVQTDVFMDFGLMGAVPVARNTQSTKALPVPYVKGITYAIEGQASDVSGKLSSKVSITTNALSPINFRLLSPPVVSSPPDGSEGVGANPTFSWEPVADAQSYVVEVFEGSDASAVLKWKGYTSRNSISFPTFPDWDMNGGALLPGITYTWTVRAYNATVESLGKAPTAPPPTRPYRTNVYESAAGGMSFTR